MTFFYRMLFLKQYLFCLKKSPTIHVPLPHLDAFLELIPLRPLRCLETLCSLDSGVSGLPAPSCLRHHALLLLQESLLLRLTMALRFQLATLT